MDYGKEQALILLVLKAFNELYPKLTIVVDHSYGPGVYCRFRPERKKISLRKVKKMVERYINSGIRIGVRRLDRNGLRRFFKSREDILRLLSSGKRRFDCYTVSSFSDHILGPVAGAVSDLPDFDLIPYHSGFVITWGDFIERPNLFRMIQEYEEWAEILGVHDAGRLNQAIEEDFTHLVLLAEALHEKKLAYIGDQVIRKRKRLVVIAGPSASGKTTFSKRLAIQLQTSGFKPVAISIDDYFLPRSETPLGSDGKPDFESLEAIDIELLNRDLKDLLGGRPVEIPKFNFRTGRPEYRGRVERVDRSGIVILEGIHGLNEELTYAVRPGVKFKIYISAITQLNIDDHNRIHTRDTRLIRRIVRDVQFRDHAVSETILNWPRVVQGEDKNIFPFQEGADIMFNSALIYELPILSHYLSPLLGRIRRKDPAYEEAKRLDNLLSYFRPVSDKPVPANSILREFIGGSIFYY
ncbi:MAG TPA: nucleoside kinase [bacterium (Candidatus Stahlbacteria)]|nr:nucleoside kinase [Candidatus Stahlbacteria bacterium]